MNNSCGVFRQINCFLILANVVLTCLWLGIAMYVVRTTRHRSVDDPTVRADEALLGMPLYLWRSPFAVFVHDGFPTKHSYLFADYSLPLMLEHHNDCPGDSCTGKVSLSLGTAAGSHGTFELPRTTFDIHYKHQSGANLNIQRIAVSQNYLDKLLYYLDINGDNTWDYRSEHTWANSQSRGWVLVDSAWHEVTLSYGELRKRIDTGEDVYFDVDAGTWRPVSD